MADLLRRASQADSGAKHPLLVKSEAVIPVESTLSAADIDGQTQFMVTVQRAGSGALRPTALAP